MMLFTEFHVDKNLEAGLRKIRLSNYREFINYTAGELVSRPLKNPVWRIQLNLNGKQRAYYLKQSPTTSVKKVIRVILGGRWPHSKAYGEMMAVRYYEKLEIPVMNPVAWGEKRVLGWPLSGFLLVEEIIGKNFEIVFNNSSSKTRKRLAYGYGSLIGYMHMKNVYDVVRCMEIICCSDNIMNFKNFMKTIDREKSQARRKFFPLSDKKKFENRSKSLAKSFHTASRSHILSVPSYYDLLAFLAGYFCETAESKKERVKLLKHTREVMDKIIDNRKRYKEFKLLINSF